MISDLIGNLRKYFWSLFGVLGVVLLWSGIWDGLGGLPFISNPLVSLGMGLVMLVSSGLLTKEFDPLHGAEEKQVSILHRMSQHPLKHQMNIKYYDKIQKKHLHVSAKNLHRVEKDAFLVLKEKNGELFIPLHRITTMYHRDREIKTLDHLKQVA